MTKHINQELVRSHYLILARLLKNLVSERFKQMARDEVLFKFVSSNIDPVLLVDLSLQAEREALDLADMSLLSLVDATRMEDELRRSSIRLQSRFQKIYGEEVADNYVSEKLLEVRIEWLRARVLFYRKWLSIADTASTALELGARAFSSSQSFESSLKVLEETQARWAEDIVKATKPLFRFLIKKQLDYESENASNLWQEFRSEAFKKPPQLKE
jgi:hypothetical protein